MTLTSNSNINERRKFERLYSTVTTYTTQYHKIRIIRKINMQEIRQIFYKEFY